MDHAGVTAEVLDDKDVGEGTAELPYLVEFLPNDTYNPLDFPFVYK